MRRAGLYDPRFEHDACGIGFVADAGGRASREIVDAALAALNRVRHRGAVAADHRSGDGAGILLPIPQSFFRDWAQRAGLIPSAPLAVATAFLSSEPGDDADRERQKCRQLLEEACCEEQLQVIGWRAVPVEPDALGDAARRTAPRIEQAIITRQAGGSAPDGEARSYRARKRAERAMNAAQLRATWRRCRSSA